MNYTNNYHLPQWEKADRVLMEDFNQAMSDIEAGIDGAVGKAASDNANAVRLANAAQATANNAYCPGKLPYAIGSYTGNGYTLKLNLGFRPSFLIIRGEGEYNTWLVGSTHDRYGVVVTDTGATIMASSIPMNANVANEHYVYIAFR